MDGSITQILLAWVPPQNPQRHTPIQTKVEYPPPPPGKVIMEPGIGFIGDLFGFHSPLY